MSKSIFDNLGILSEHALLELQKRASDTSCECPAHLIKIFETVKAFTAYQENCVNEKPQDEHIHQWLRASSKTLEHQLSNIIITLARFEGMIDENNKFNDDI